MALVTIQRSPSPSTEDDLDTAGSSEDAIDGKSAIKRRSKSARERLKKIVRSVHFITKLRPCLSDSYFTVKGAALILPNNEFSKKSSRKSHGGEIQGHLQAMLHLLRPEDKIKIAVRLEDVSSSKFNRYMALVSTLGRQDTEEAVILGIDCCKGEAACIRLVLPVWLGVSLRLGGDGGFSLCTDQQAYLFDPVSVQAMWSAIQSLVRVMHVAEDKKYLQDGLSHTWVDYYRAQINADLNRNSHWNVEGVEIFAPSCLSLGSGEKESVKLSISASLREVMMNVDLDDATSKSLRMAVEEKLGITLKLFKSYFDEEVLRILGQMDAPSKILDYLYLGSEWNASNLDELKDIGIGYILNITQEIDNFFSGMFQYFNVRLYDVEQSDLLKHWDKTFKFISKARDHGSKVLVHCKMGISRSASSVMAYLMKLNRWSVEEAHAFVKARRGCVRPNCGFMEQLHMYEAILSASNKRDIFRVRSDPNLLEDKASEEGEQCQGYLLGDSLFHVMSRPDWLLPGSQSLDKEEEWLRTNEHMEPGIVEMETDVETVDSRSGDSVEETHPDIPSPPPSSNQVNTSAASSPTSPLETQFSSDSLADGSSHLSLCDDMQTGGLQSRIKPDSSWIKITACEDMNEECGADVLCEPMCAQEDCMAESEQQSFLTTEHHSVSYNSLPDGMQLEKSISEYKVGLHVEEFPFQPHSENTSNGEKEFERASVSQFFSRSLEHKSMMTGQSDIRTTPSVSSPHIFADALSVTSSVGFDQNGNPMAVNESHSATTDQSLHSIPSSSSEEMSSECTLASRGVEVGVREYFYREKIPWNPGKVKKIREGINRTGHLVSPTSDESSREEMSQSDNNEELMAVDSVNSDRIELSTSKEDDVQQQTDSNEEMESQPYASSPDEESAMEAGANSLYDKEDIPLQPGTVMRTRMEIEERARSWCEGDMTQSKPVLRTSSLKYVKDPSVHSEKSKRRVSCGPIIEQGPGRDEEAIFFFNDEELDQRAEDVGDGNRMPPPASDENFENAGEKDGQQDNALPQSQVAVSLQAFGDDITIQQGLVKKHKMEIETKQDSRQKTSTVSVPAFTDQSVAHPASKPMLPVRESSTEDEPACVQGHSSILLLGPAPLSQTNLPMDITRSETMASDGEHISMKGNCDTASLSSEIGPAFVMRSHTEQAVDEEMNEGEDTGGASNLVKFFVSKIEKQTGDSRSPRQIDIVESYSEIDKVIVLSADMSEDVQCDSSKSGTNIDLGFVPGESRTDDDSSTSPSKSQPLSPGDTCEPSVVRHLVGRFEVKHPAEESVDAFVCREFPHESGNAAMEEPCAPHHSVSTHSNPISSSIPTSLASLSSSVVTPKSTVLQKGLHERTFIPISSHTSQPYASSKTALRKDPVVPAFQTGTGTGDRQTHTLRPPPQRPRPKSADQVRNEKLVQEESESGAYAFPQSSHRQFSSGISPVEGRSDSSLVRQCSEDSRKVRKLHGKSHPLTKLASQQQQQQHQRGSPFHSSM